MSLNARIPCLPLILGAMLLFPLWAQGAEPKWESLLSQVDTKRDAVAGTWTGSAEALEAGTSSGARLVLPVAPQGEYDFRVTFTRRTGVHSIALFCPVGEGRVAFEVDAWGQHLGGFQNVAGRSLQENSTRKTDVALTNGRKYTMTVEVRKGEIRGLLDDKVLATLRTDGRDLTVPDLWRLPEGGHLGIGAWESETTFHDIAVRVVSGPPLQVARATPARKAAPAEATRTRPAPSPAPTPAPTTGTAGSAAGKRVLLVIANYHFFYREYAEPRAEMERAGIKVTVAAGRKAPCRPHNGSGEGGDGGIVQPDIALESAKAADYDAILFSGGWGASAYQFAFNGRYNDPQYNGDRGVKTHVNRLINEFLQQDKPVCALCNAVSVLAWARVDGKSPLAGKRVCAPTREAAAGLYNGRPAQPSCRWHPEANGAQLSPAGAIGRPGTAEDDVVVDGNIVTGEDDISAREMGRVIVGLLSKR